MSLRRHFKRLLKKDKQERRLLPQTRPYGLILMHDASSHLKIVREAALKT